MQVDDLRRPGYFLLFSFGSTLNLPYYLHVEINVTKYLSPVYKGFIGELARIAGWSDQSPVYKGFIGELATRGWDK